MNDNKYNAIVSVMDCRKEVEGPLSGWEIAIKDNINVKGYKTTASSKMLENYESVYNATVVDKLLNAGAHLVAKTSMDELGMGGYNLTALTGPVLNPHDIQRTSGGSSGGSAALVAAKQVRAAIGTDTGDSIRKPASYCGVVGLKPTYGLISRYGVIPYAGSLDHVGVFTQNVADAKVLLESLSGKDEKDMTTHDVALNLKEELNLEDVTVGVFKNVVEAIDDERVLAVFNHQLNKLKTSGVKIIEKSMPEELAGAIYAVYAVISNAEAITHHANLDGVRFGLSVEGDSLEDSMKKSRGAGFGFQVKERFIYGAYALDGENQLEIYDQARKVRRLIVESYADMFDDVDFMLVPATAGVAPKLEEIPETSKNEDHLIRENHMVVNNFSGYPSITIPMGELNHMPLGINITAKPFEDIKLLEFASKLEEGEK
ncbi:MAG: Asp-tRNA(Asn)/Glu-tRNA(Gln) amidotransferase subunit GatA [Erysipelothrix sp.]|nr:Asp-tRNA(Asn)/Glu-tRNA(Gln) amidotransferase subunit GatA [Erysipelothrix sp.]